MRETEDYYFFYRHEFGQWTMRTITDPDGIMYNCCEQYMMYKKACLFGDKDMANKILLELDPSKQRKMGRLVKNYDEGVWEKNRFGIVWYGNYLKFTQHEDLRDRLLATGDKLLVEASPSDRIWGIGLDAKDDAILDSDNWRGKNLLGNALVLVRLSLTLE